MSTHGAGEALQRLLSSFQAELGSLNLLCGLRAAGETWKTLCIAQQCSVPDSVLALQTPPQWQCLRT